MKPLKPLQSAAVALAFLPRSFFGTPHPPRPLTACTDESRKAPRFHSPPNAVIANKDACRHLSPCKSAASAERGITRRVDPRLKLPASCFPNPERRLGQVSFLHQHRLTDPTRQVVCDRTGSPPCLEKIRHLLKENTRRWLDEPSITDNHRLISTNQTVMLEWEKPSAPLFLLSVKI